MFFKNFLLSLKRLFVCFWREGSDFSEERFTQPLQSPSDSCPDVIIAMGTSFLWRRGWIIPNPLFSAFYALPDTSWHRFLLFGFSLLVWLFAFRPFFWVVSAPLFMLFGWFRAMRPSNTKINRHYDKPCRFDGILDFLSGSFCLV